MKNDFPHELEAERRAIEASARREGLDPFETIFEIVTFDQMNQIAAFGGFPQRYPHWRFGMEYERLRKTHTYGLGKIYEMVINNDPCYAYLLEDNALVDQKLVMAHVMGHSDFFKHNVWFSQTDRKMMDGMANHGTRVRRHIERFGYETVEKFIDVCLSLEDLIDPHSVFIKRMPEPPRPGRPTPRESIEQQLTRYPAKSYMDRYINPPETLQRERERGLKTMEQERRAFPPAPERDVLLFLLQHAPLEDWQADVLDIIREEAYYYAPQGMTKVMNEGWASYWHSYLMTHHHLRDHELVTYADHHSGTMYTAPGQFNPYKLGIELFRDIEDRWNKGRFGKEFEECDAMEKRRAWDTGLKQGRQKIFEVRRIYNDVMFIDEFLTQEFVDRYKMYQYRRDPATGRMVAVDRDYQHIKRQLLFMLTNFARPYIFVADGNYANRGELFLSHRHMGVDLDIKYSTECLRNIHALWQRPVHLSARIDDDMMLFTFDGRTLQQQKIKDDFAKPAHSVS